MNTLCFDVRAPYASFRIPSTTRGFMTFPVPPRTAILGLLGSILGVERNELYLEDHFLYNSKIAIQVKSKSMTINFRTNQTQTRYLRSLMGGNVKIYVPGKLDRGMRSPQSIILLTNVKYRLFVSLDDETILDDLERRIKMHFYVYPPYLGRVNFFASIKYVDRMELTKMGKGLKSAEIITICASRSLTEIEVGDYIMVTNVPMAYIAKKTRKGINLEPSLLTNIIYSEKPLQIKTAEPVYQIQETKIEDLQGKNIMFLPFN